MRWLPMFADARARAHTRTLPRRLTPCVTYWLPSGMRSSMQPARFKGETAGVQLYSLEPMKKKKPKQGYVIGWKTYAGMIVLICKACFTHFSLHCLLQNCWDEIFCFWEHWQQPVVVCIQDVRSSNWCCTKLDGSSPVSDWIVAFIL